MTNILVVDDSSTMRRMVKASLCGVKDLVCAEAGNGLEAIEKMAIGTVDLIVADLNMPDMHGLELIEFVRRQEAYRSIPIIVLTTRSDETSRAEAIAAGASEYLTKPFHSDVLAAEVRRFLKHA
jgi:two-component system, chemotaxis family, chemotaxis protein CheY